MIPWSYLIWKTFAWKRKTFGGGGGGEWVAYYGKEGS